MFILKILTWAINLIIKSITRSLIVLGTMMEKMKTICFTNILISYCEHGLRKGIEY